MVRFNSNMVKKDSFIHFVCKLRTVPFSRIDAVDHLRTNLCSLHVPAQEQKNDILDIVEYEKQGQSPIMVVVIDFFSYLAVDPTQNGMQHLTTR